MAELGLETDLILCGAIVAKDNEEKIEDTIKSVDKHKFRKKYILFDGPPQSRFKEDYDKYTKYKKYIKEQYPDFTVIEYPDNIFYKPMLSDFIKSSSAKPVTGKGNELAKNLLIIQDDVVLDDFDLEKVLETKGDFDDCKILYFRENRLRCKHWFNVIDDSQALIKTHGWSERVYLTTKEDFTEIHDNLPSKGGKNGMFMEVYYQNMMQRKTWATITEEEQLDYWKKWGCYEHKEVHHKHLVAKRS